MKKESKITVAERILSINQAAENGDVDRVKYFCKNGGLINSALRSKCWPLLLSVDPETCIVNPKSLVKEHKYANQIDRDVERSLWNVADAHREEKREQLAAVINAILCTSPKLHYFQGYHDIASVFLINCGDRMAYSLLHRLSYYHIRDNMNADMECNIHVVHQVLILLELADPDLAEFIKSAELQPYYLLSWVLTWFAHEVDELDTISRLFDYFLASNPYAPVYLTVAVLIHNRDRILAQEKDCTLYSFLSKLLTEHSSLPWEVLIANSEKHMSAFVPEVALSLPPPYSNMKSFPYYNMANSDVDSSSWLQSGSYLLVGVFGVVLTAYVAGI